MQSSPKPAGRPVDATCAPLATACLPHPRGVPGSQIEYQCLPLPETCVSTGEPDCSCFDLANRAGCDCRQDVAGTIFVECAAP